MLSYHLYTFDTNKVHFWRRLVAYLIDFAILSLMVATSSVLIGLNKNFNYYILLCTYMVYASGMDSYYGATLGKMIMKLRILNSNGGKISLLSAFYRNLIKIIFTTTGFEILLFPFTKGFSGIHNRAVKTSVVKV